MSVVLWSGGCDSTLVLYDLMKEQYDKREFAKIKVVSIVHNQVNAAAESRRARKQILKWFKKKGWGTPYHYEVTIDGCNADKGRGLTQPPIWLSMGMLHTAKDEDLYCGYIKTDCIWHYVGFLHQAFNNLQGLLGKSGTLQMPLEWETKAGVIKRLKEAGLYDLTWYCEQPKRGAKCGDCEPCITHEMGLKLNARRSKSARPASSAA
jgi:7-cyano-7-deazaguanine synthase in queuosine biosynthesis